MNNETISGRCRKIRQQLTDLLTVLENGSMFAQVSTTVTSSSVKDVLEKFMLWAGSQGALRKPDSKLSLDSRLASSPDLQDYICTELAVVSEALEDLMDIVNGSMPNRKLASGSVSENVLVIWSDESSHTEDPIHEAASILQVISQGITLLLKVQQPPPSGTDRLHRAFRDSANMDTLLDGLDIDYVRRMHPKLGDGVQSSRIGRAIAMRRLFIRLSRDHKYNLAAKENDGEDTSHPQIGSQRDITAKQSSKATTFDAKEDLMDILAGSVDILGEGQEDDISHCSDSTTSQLLAVLKLPRLADLSPEDDPFECPICYTLQRFRSEQAWRRHAYRDLKAYVCTVGGTDCDDKFFEDRTSWFDHELEEHRCNYICVLCGVNDGKPKTTRSNLRQHIVGAHGDFESDQLKRLEEAGRETMTSFKASDCPFCDDWSELIARVTASDTTYKAGDDVVVSINWFEEHVATHLEQLAIYALSCNGLQSLGWGTMESRVSFKLGPYPKLRVPRIPLLHFQSPTFRAPDPRPPHPHLYSHRSNTSANTSLPALVSTEPTVTTDTSTIVPDKDNVDDHASHRYTCDTCWFSADVEQEFDHHLCITKSKHDEMMIQKRAPIAVKNARSFRFSRSFEELRGLVNRRPKYGKPIRMDDSKKEQQEELGHKPAEMKNRKELETRPKEKEQAPIRPKGLHSGIFRRTAETLARSVPGLLETMHDHEERPVHRGASKLVDEREAAVESN